MGLGLLLSGSKGAELRNRHPHSHWKTRISTTEVQESQLPGSLGQEGTEPLSRPLGSGRAWPLALVAAWRQEKGLEPPLPISPEASIPKAKLKRFVIVSFIFLFLFTLLI